MRERENDEIPVSTVNQRMVIIGKCFKIGAKSEFVVGLITKTKVPYQQIPQLSFSF